MRFPRTVCLLTLLALTSIQAHSLNILLTNDDGYDHPWIRAVQNSLSAAGHEVTLIAPATNQSGKAAGLTLSGVEIDNPEPGIYAVPATPATAVRLGVDRIMDQRPDLVVSGINDAANIGVLSSFSGTVGATIAALHMVGESIPAIAISGNPIDGDADPRSAANVAHAREIADFLSRLIARLEEKAGEHGGLLPSGIALNINYPALPGDQIKGVGIYRHGRDLSAFFQSFQEEGDAANTGADGPADRDTTALQKGYITIVPMDGDYTAQGWQKVLPGDYFESLAP